MADSPEMGMSERVRALLHRSRDEEIDAHAHNYLTIAGPADDVARFIAAARSDDDATRLPLPDRLAPIEYGEQHVAARVRTWGDDQRPDVIEQHNDDAYAAFGFTSDEVLTPQIRDVSVQYPALTFRYAHFLHATDDAKDRFGGAVYLAGEELGRHHESADDLPEGADEAALGDWRISKFAAAIATTDSIEAERRAA